MEEENCCKKKYSILKPNPKKYITVHTLNLAGVACVLLSLVRSCARCFCYQDTIALSMPLSLVRSCARCFCYQDTIALSMLLSLVRSCARCVCYQDTIALSMPLSLVRSCARCCATASSNKLKTFAR